MLTRREARMIAEELYKLMKANEPVKDEFLTRKQAATMLNVSVSYLAHKKDAVPSKIVNGKRLYSKRMLNELVYRGGVA